MLPRALTSLQPALLAYLIATCIFSTAWPSQQQRRWGVHAVELSPDGAYAPDFAYLDRSIIGRQEQQNNELNNNVKKEMDINPGTTSHFVLKRSQRRVVRAEDDGLVALEARDMEKRQAGTVWITANTCRQPAPTQNDTKVAKNNPQLVMYVSSQNQKPGPDSTQNLLTDPTGLLFDSGFANFSVQSDSDIYVGISAPNLDKNWFGSWHFEVVASSDGPYHSYNATDPFLFMVDTDSESALFITYNLSDSSSPDTTDKWKEKNPFRMYAFPAGAGSPITGVEHSFCAIKELFNTTNNLTVATSITNKFGAGLPKSQFHVQGLENGKVYNGFLVVDGNQSETMSLPGVGQVRGGGKVFQQFNWTTKVEDSCQVLFDLEFCDTVAYAVPSSPEFKFNDDALKKLYDDRAQEYYTNFSHSLAQVACETSSDAQYSLARTCKDCERDYKNWLCSVSIPRCEDWSAPDNFLQSRNVNAPFANGTSLTLNETMRDRYGYNQSRNSLIDDVIKPGPYKEMLPCFDLCVDIVRSCPANLKFACPNDPARRLTYGFRESDQDSLTCNFPGAVVRLNFQGAAGTLSAPVQAAIIASAFAIGMLLI